MSQVTHRAWNSLTFSRRFFNVSRIFGVKMSLTADAKITLPVTTEEGHDLFSLPRIDDTTNLHQLTKEVIFKALKIPKESLQALLKGGIKKRTYKRTKFNFVRPAEDDGCRYLLLAPEAAVDFDSWKECPVLAEHNIERVLTDYNVTLKYDDFNADEVLRAVLPGHIEVPSAFSRIGHIAHMNLRDEQMPYKQLIGKVMLDKIQGIQTVVNKTNEISNQYRVFPMEVIAGENNFISTVKEHHCTFHLDFSKVYWNPRLSTEHERIVKKVGAQVIFDVFAGIGPFAVPAAKRGCQVHANDLNPESFVWLQKNVTSNKVERNVKCYNMDGRSFIMTILKGEIIKMAGQSESDKPQRVHVAMNLPASAVEFLDAFRGLLAESTLSVQDVPPMWVHCYCFTKEEDMEAAAQRMVEGHLGCGIQQPEVHNVRNVAPNKEMMCVSFKMPVEVLWSVEQSGSSKREAEDRASDNKRTRLDDRGAGNTDTK